MTDAHSPFKQGECPVEVALTEGEQTHLPRGKYDTSGVSDRLANPAPFVPEASTLSERAQFGMAPGEHGTGTYGGHDELTEALAAPRPVEGRHRLPEAVDRPTIIPWAA